MAAYQKFGEHAAAIRGAVLHPTATATTVRTGAQARRRHRRRSVQRRPTWTSKPF